MRHPTGIYAGHLIP